jgi:hypothetical protein
LRKTLVRWHKNIKMNKYSLNDVVKFSRRPGLFTIVMIEPGEAGYIYALALKSQYDKIDIESKNAPFEDMVVFYEVAEDDLQYVFSQP